MSSENDDTAAAIATEWPLSQLGTLEVVQPLERVFYDKQDGRPDFPYTEVEIKQEKDPIYPLNRFPGWQYQDFRRVTFTVRHNTKEAVGLVINAIQGLKITSVPNSRKVLDWTPKGPSKIEPDGRRDQVPVYAGTVSFILWMQRTIP